MIDSEKLKSYAAEYDFALTQAQIQKLDTFAEFLVETNKLFNLTAIVQPDDIVEKHFIDSFIFTKYIQKNPKKNALIDIGSGAGIPAIPIAILRPDICVTANESNLKKCSFITDSFSKLNISGNVLNGRAEELAKVSDHREKYDYAVARGVAELRILAELLLPFVKVNGFMIASKGSKLKDELEDAASAIRALGGQLVSVEQVMLHNEQVRNLVIIAKISHTPTSLPRIFSKIKTQRLKEIKFANYLSD